jgi:putative DNA primase/helicase
MSKPIKELVQELKASYPRIEEAIPGLKRKSDKEYCGACPNPGCKVDNDGFLVFPKTQKFWCRGCECHGDIIEYYRMTGHGTMMQQLEEAGLLEEDASNKRLKSGSAGAKENLASYIWKNSSHDQTAAETIQKAFAFRSIQLELIPPNIRLNSYKGQLSIACAMQPPLDDTPPAKPQCVHLTLLDNGRKCGTRYQGPKTGRVGMLPGKDNRSLVIGEGLETTLSAVQATGYSGMFCGDAGNMAGLSKMREQFQEIFILVDSDDNHAGQKAALKAAESIGKANKATVWLIAPDDSCFTDAPKKLDFNDLLMKDTSGGSIKARFERKQRLDEIGWRPPEKESSEKAAGQDKKKPAEVWSLADVKETLEHPELLKWMVCAPDQELDTIQRHEIAEEILLHNNFRPAELNAVKEMLKKQLGIAKGEQDKILKAARKKKEYGDQWFLVEEGGKGELRLIAQNRAAEKISEMIYDKYMFASDIQHWHSFTGTHWADDSKDDNFGSHLVDVLGDGAGDVGFNAGYMAGVESIMIRSGKHKPAAENGNTRVPFQNGILDPETKEFQETTPENALRWCLPYKYDPNAKCELFDWWLDFACDDDTGGLQKQILAVINVCLIERPDLQYFLHLVGEPGTGKGLFARLLQAIVGPEGFWKSDFRLLEENQFEPTNYYQKRLVQFDEVPAHVKINKFLQLTGRDRLRYEEKKKQATQHFIFTGLVLLLGNSLFSTDDQTTFAIERRRRTVRFDKEIPSEVLKEFADAGGEELLHEEIPGIINKALRMSREEVTEIFRNPPAKVVKANQEAEETSSPVVKFVTEHVLYDPAGKVYPGVRRLYKGEGGRDEYERQEDKLYPRYLAWCSREDKKPLARGKALDAILRAINRKLVPEGGAKVETGKPDMKGTPVLGIGLVPWEQTEFGG